MTKKAEKKRYTIDCSKDGKTKQEFKDQCDLNNIMSKAARGILPDYNNMEGQYIDVSKVGDYQDAVNRVANAQSEFERLPGNIKAEFRNDPANLVAFMDGLKDSPEDARKAAELGLISFSALATEDPQKPVEEPKTEKTEE